MNLNATSHIVTNTELIAELNAKYSNGNNILSPEVFYTKQLLDTIRLDGDQYCYYRLADVSPIGEKADKLALRRWAPLQAHTQPLTEGMPPMSDKGSVEKYEITCAQYGRYMEFSDHVDFKIVDPIIAFYTQEYSLVAVETLDLLAREALFSIANLAFAGGAADIKTLAANSIDATKAASAKPHMDDLRKIVLSLKKRLVKPRMNGRFHVIGSPEFYFDMIDDERVKNYMSYNQTTDTMYSNSKLVPMFEMEFYETLCCPSSGEFFNADGKRCLLVKYNSISESVSTPTIGFLGEVAGITGSLNYATGVDAYDVSSGYVKDQRTGEDASYIPNLGTWTMPADTATVTDVEEYKVQHILVVGKDALIRTGLSGEDSAKMYVKQKGSSGVLDPIDQRQSIGFKINSVGFGSARLEAVVDYVCVPSTLNF